MTRFIDLSIPITTHVVSDPPVMRPQVTYMTHENTWEQTAMFFPGMTRDDLPEGEGWAVASVTLSNHTGPRDRKSVVAGKMVLVSIAIGGRRNIKKIKLYTTILTKI